MFNKHYVYEHRSEDGRLIYLGIGVFGRAWEQKGRDKYHRSIIENYTHNYVELIHTHLTKEEALIIERRLIIDEDPLCNIQHKRK